MLDMWTYNKIQDVQNVSGLEYSAIIGTCPFAASDLYPLCFNEK